jgi:ketosteroid isomerase-like protein
VPFFKKGDSALSTAEALWRAEETTAANGRSIVNAVQNFWDAYNRQNIPELLTLCEDNVRWDDYDYSEACVGASALEKRLRLEQQQWPTAEARSQVEVQHILVDGSGSSSEAGKAVVVGVYLTKCENRDDVLMSRRGCAVMTISESAGRARVRQVDLVAEQHDKGGESKLRLLQRVSPLLSAMNGASSLSRRETGRIDVNLPSDSMTAAERYFEAWNRRNMTEAVHLFAPNVTYHDSAFPKPFAGRNNLRKHLELCAEVLPPQLTFEVDRVIFSHGTTGPSCNSRCYSSILAQWHANINGQSLPYTRGCSIYQLNNHNGLIESGLDFVEPNGPVKPGGIRLASRIIRSCLEREPRRLIPAVTWLTYIYLVFLSDGILPGANALVLEERTWKEVLDLSLNFFLVAPLLHLPFSPVVHPILEAVFNILLSWAGLFAGFLADDRRDKPNLLPMGPVVVGMQFLTSAFLLPYLAVRSVETRSMAPICRDDTSPATQWIGENRLWGLFLGSVGAGSILWGFVGRTDDFGTDLSERWSSFIQLLSIDRVGSSFLVDLAIFGVFQGWLVDDDLKRRGFRPGLDAPWWLPAVAKYVPFFGLALYLASRPTLPETGE